MSQRMGLEWISAAIAEFVALYPKAVITNYEGEVALLALKALADIEVCDPPAAQRLRALDYGWMEEEFADNQPLQREAMALISQIGR